MIETSTEDIPRDYFPNPPNIDRSIDGDVDRHVDVCIDTHIHIHVHKYL